MLTSVLQTFLGKGFFFSLEVHTPAFHSANVFLIFRILMASTKFVSFKNNEESEPI